MLYIKTYIFLYPPYIFYMPPHKCILKMATGKLWQHTNQTD